MTRGEVSAADRELAARLAERGLSVSAAQLERWRHAGLVPANVRRGLGRGRGSVSVPAQGAVEAAAALARHARPGRDLRWTVLAWYAEAGHPVLPGQEPVPEPPWREVRAALLWAVEHDRIRLLRAAALSVRTDADMDGWYAAAEQLVRRGPSRAPHPERLRTMLLTDPAGPAPRWHAPAGDAPALVQLLAATALGPAEIGGGALTGALAALGLPGGSAAAEVEVEVDEEIGDLNSRVDLRDPLERVAGAGEQDLAAARDAALILAGIGGLYLLYGLLMPDTPALAALRGTLDAAGLGEFARQTFASMTTPRGIARTLQGCLDPTVANLATALRRLMADHAGDHGLLHRPGTAGGAEQYGRDWLAAIQALIPATPGRPG
jgi:hypothetical protein